MQVGGGVITVGQADIINSVAAVKHLVFDEKKCTMDELIKALDADFVGYEDIQNMCLDAPKYGNDDERADFCVGEIFSHVVDQFETYETAFGKMTCGMLPVSGNTPIGQWVGALPSGRNAKTPLTDGIGATGGTDINGPTALLKSVSRIFPAWNTTGTATGIPSKTIRYEVPGRHERTTAQYAARCLFCLHRKWLERSLRVPPCGFLLDNSSALSSRSRQPSY